MDPNMASLKITILAAILYLSFPSETIAVHKYIYSSPTRSSSPHIYKCPPPPPPETIAVHKYIYSSPTRSSSPHIYKCPPPPPPVYKSSPPSPLVYKSPPPPSLDYKAPPPPPPLYNRPPSLLFHKSPSPPPLNYKSPSSQPLDYKSSSTPPPNYKASPPPPPVYESSPPTYKSPPPVYNFESKLIIAFCLSSAIKMAVPLTSTYSNHPFQLHLLSLAIALAFASLFVGNFISYKFPFAAYVLEQASVIFAATAYIIAISVPFPSYIKCMTWLVFAISVLAILICNYLG